MPILVYALGTELYNGIGILPASNTWYICSADNTDYIAYDVQQVSDGQKEISNFGTIVKGNPPPSFPNQLGLLTYVTNYTGLQLFIDPSHPNSSFYNNISCSQGPRLRCYQKKDPPFQNKDILCLSVVNPHNNGIKFSLSISFTSGVDVLSATGTSSFSAIGTTNVPEPVATHSVSPNLMASGGDVGSGGTGVWWVLMGVGVANFKKKKQKYTLYTFG
ncbi:10120_t:CDS:2 [Gigaspora margarita]|uniref:10120_t:CDS:1 n=1 Tax=Gigaspora margarita TaxID=4874 RepID=A0ABM8W021_GIGMA|nr:10120_t:CDS:2 [Gigaspora margarita]